MLGGAARRAPATQRRHIGFDPSLVDEHQPRDVDPALICFPSDPLTGDVGAILVGW